VNAFAPMAYSQASTFFLDVSTAILRGGRLSIAIRFGLFHINGRCLSPLSPRMGEPS
jgi:hypothetical protein